MDENIKDVKEEQKVICPTCKNEILDITKGCPKCKVNQKFPVGWLVVIIIVAIFVFAVAFNLGKANNNSNESQPVNNNSLQNPQTNDNDSSVVPDEEKNPTKDKVYGFNETFVFDNLKITIRTDYSFDVVDNMFSDYDGKTVVKLPITIENISGETHGLNYFDYKIYGTKGTKAEDLGVYFDDDIRDAGDLRSGASYTTYIHFLYDGDGRYAIEFDNWDEKVTAEFPITANNNSSENVSV